jgi:hypothetical protein
VGLARSEMLSKKENASLNPVVQDEDMHVMPLTQIQSRGVRLLGNLDTYSSFPLP